VQLVSATFWQRVHESYDGALKTTDRAPSALHNRWRVDQRNVSKFCGAYTAIENRNERGKTYDDRVQDACALYEVLNGASSVILPLWLLLRITQKWKELFSKPKGRTVDALSHSQPTSALSEK
jgi:hypothetical protein